ncbi:transposase [Pseudogracilibacillus sp. SO30301A]|uniref:transposase n=1 Tax=Pseudogracilibacillus sp. SO30301A TaxID=3098291 RepID=UPI003FA6FB63
MAYNFHNGLRRFYMPKKMKKHQVQTIRLRLIKISGKITRSGRYISFKLASSSLYKKEFLGTLRNIQGLPKLC